jgi:hypothetical protein
VKQSINSKLAIGPMSTEIIQAVFEFSNANCKQMMLIASKNQIDHSGGYVNGWNTRQYSDFINHLKIEYPNSDVVVCRDHCGPGFNGSYLLEDTYRTVEADVEAGFDLIHVDLCKSKTSRDDKLKLSRNVVEYIYSISPSTKVEIGTDEIGSVDYDIGSIEQDLDFFLQFCKPEFYVVRTGSLVKENRQVGNFEIKNVISLHESLNKRDVKLKEHNADYLNDYQIRQRKGIVDAVNIAPQLGVVQTEYCLKQCEKYNVSTDEFKNISYKSQAWKKWMIDDRDDKEQCVLLAGHYNFSSDEYKRMIDQLVVHQPLFYDDLTKKIHEIFSLYITNL